MPMNPYVDRSLNPAEPKSLFLFGPRQTGKSMLVRHSLPRARVFDLLDGATFLALAQSPARLGEESPKGEDVIVVDEIQKLPSLLDEVHRLIENRQAQIASDARVPRTTVQEHFDILRDTLLT